MTGEDMVYRVYAEKKKHLDQEAKALTESIRDFLGIKSFEKLRLLNRYDLENISKELFDYAVQTVLSEPQLDDVFYELPETDASAVFAVEYLPGQYDQRGAVHPDPVAGRAPCGTIRARVSAVR